MPRHDAIAVHHVSIVGGQTMPTLLTILDTVAGGHRLSKVTLLCSADTKTQAKWIADGLEQMPECAPPDIEVVVVDPFDHRAVTAAIAFTAKPPVRIDLTGGTKLMSIGAFEAARDYSFDWTYVAMERDELRDSSSEQGRGLDPRVLAALSLQSVIRAHGQRAATRRADFTHLEQARALARLIARGRPYARRQLHGALNGRVKYQALEKPLGLLEEWGWVSLTRSGADRWAERSGSCPWNTAGDWLELYVAGEVAEIPDCREVSISTRGGIELDGELVADNEHDVMFLYRGRLVTIECKGGPFAKEVFEERNSLRAIWGGRYARTGLVALEHKSSERTNASSLLRRASARGVFVAACDELLDLRVNLKQYLRDSVVQT